jgi:hypothetical protein
VEKPNLMAARALIQLRDGWDFPKPRQILSTVRPEQAAALPPGFKYSLLTLVEHTRLWQELWLCQLRGGKRPNVMKDWRIPDPPEWPSIRKEFLDGLDEAIAIAESDPFVHHSADDAKAFDKLIQICVHDTYHVGQFVVVKRAMKLAVKDA